MIGRMIRAFGADDIANPRTTFRKLRFQMIADIPEKRIGKCTVNCLC